MQEEIKQMADAFGGGFWGYASAVIVAVSAAVWGFIKWSANRLYSSFELRLDKMEKSVDDAHDRIDVLQKGQSDIKEILSSMMTAEQVIKLYDRQSEKLEKVAERMDRKQDITNSEISTIKNHLMNRQHNERRDDK